MMLMLLVINETIWSIQVLGSTSAIVDVNSFLAHYGAATKVGLGSFDPVSSLPIGLEHGACSICCGCNFHACRRLEHDTTIRPGIARAAGWLWLLHLWQTTKWKHNTTQSRRCSSSSFSSFHIFPVCVGQLFFVFFCSCDIYSSPLRLCQPSCHSTTFTSYSSPVSLSVSPFLQPLWRSHARTHTDTSTHSHTCQ